MFSDLPRFTMKSVRRCPQCEHFNGYKASTCGNKKCKHALKPKTNSKIPPVESCQIITNFASPKCVSVRVNSKGPDYRAFVELNKIQNSQSNSKLSLTVVSARCSVTFCVRSTISNANDVPSKSPRCTHIEAAMNCSTVAGKFCFCRICFSVHSLVRVRLSCIHQSPLKQSNLSKGIHVNMLNSFF